VCCASFSGTSLTSACAASCTGTSAQLCNGSSDCPAGDTCQTAAGYGICIPSNIGQGGDGGEPNTDGGSSTVTDGSASDAAAD
jgi:hypothetical protein